MKLDELPAELILHIAPFLQADEASYLAACNKHFQAIMLSDDVWRPRCASIWHRHSDQGFLDVDLLCQGIGRGYRRLWIALLGSYARYLGYWASQLPFTGRLVRFCLQCQPASNDMNFDSDWLDRFRILAYEITAVNNVQAQDIADERPFGAWYNSEDSAFMLPRHHRSLDRGLSVDIFRPSYTQVHMLEIRAKSGARLLTDGPNGTHRPTLPLTIRYEAEYKSPVNAYRALAGNNVGDLMRGGNSLPTFPTTAAAYNGMIRGTVTSNANKTWMTTSSLTWVPAIESSPAETTEVDFEVPPREGPNFIYQTPPARPPPRRVLPATIRVVRGLAEALPMVFQWTPDNTRNTDAFSEQMAGSGETFIPIVDPGQPPRLQRAASIHPKDVRGIWSGNYGPHGVEFGYINLRTVLVEKYGDEVDIASIAEDDGSIPDDDPTYTKRQILEYVKLTGDYNVPSGAVSWSAIIPEDGTIPSIAASDLRKLMQTSPESRTAQDTDWQAGTVAGRGQIAFSGFIEPRYINAQVTFVRSPHPAAPECDTIDQIRVRWRELHRVTVYSRVK